MTLGIDSKDSLEKLFKEKRGCKVKRIWQDKRWETKEVCFGFPEEKDVWGGATSTAITPRKPRST